MKTTLAITLFFAWAICAPSQATPLIKRSYKELSNGADVIVIARLKTLKVTETKKFFELNELNKQALFEVRSVLKGSYGSPNYDYSYPYYTGTPKQIRMTREQIDTRSPLKNHLSRLLEIQHGFEEGASYLIFLKMNGEKVLKPWGHRYGFKKLSDAIQSEYKKP